MAFTRKTTKAIATRWFAAGSLRLLLAAAGVLMALSPPAPAWAHCDTLEGPVVAAARQALASGDLVPLLRWVPAPAEAEVNAAFARARIVREASPAARELADRWFFETVVRLHRQGEGLPFSGLAPPEAAIDPAIADVDRALADGSVDSLARQLGSDVEQAIRERFANVLLAREHADESVERGRGMVAAYVGLTHFAEQLHRLIADGEAPAEHGSAHEVPGGARPHAAREPSGAAPPP